MTASSGGLSRRLTTAVIGAGPAGLLFSLIARLLFERMGGKPDRFALRLYDKRETYVRSHRLRMAPEPYLAIQRDVDDPRFDAVIALLKEHHFSPEVNQLEGKLSGVLADLGIQKSLLEVGEVGEAMRLSDLRRKLEAEGLVGPETELTIVGADSVHSVIRDWVRGATEPQRHTHERVARVRVVGDDLPARLGVVDQYRLSKVLGSVVDYRLNKNGFAELDLFLTEEEHAVVGALGATPKDPVELSASMLKKMRAPLFRAIVEHLERGSRRLLLQSTFRLEHAVMPRVAFDAPAIRAKVFLVGDAGVSLPFFRGMACLAACAHSLARVHCAMLEGEADPVGVYNRAVEAIVRREVSIVRSRAQLVRGLRELVRVSSMLPFPIQSWWLSAGRARVADAMSPGAYFNAVIALGAAALAGSGYISPWLALSSLPVEIAGGVAYRWTLDLEPGPHRWLRRVWEIQIAVVLVGGVITAVTGRAHWIGAGWWLLLGGSFVVGIYTFELLIARRLRRALLEEA
jgi:hypothetical protein